MANDITLVGRCSRPEIDEYDSGARVARFNLSFRRGDRTDVVACEAWGEKLSRKAETIGQGDLIGVIGKVRSGNYIMISCLEPLG